MSTNPLPPWGPFYGDAPLLQDAVNHAERLTQLLTVMRPRPRDDRGAAWLVGRSEEMETFVELIILRWRFEGLDEAAAAGEIDAYLDALHRGLAFHFGEMSLRCCCGELFATSVPESALSQTAEIPTHDAIRRSSDAEATAVDVEPNALLLGLTMEGSTPVPRI
jgi:hypothetical protein